MILDEALDNFIAKFDKPLLQQPFKFMLWKAPKLGLVKNPDTCGWDIVQEEKAVGFEVMDYTEYKDQYLVDPGGHTISCVAGFRVLSENCKGNDFAIFGPFFDPDKKELIRNPKAEGYIYAFRTWRRLGLVRFLATTIFRDHHFDYSCDNPTDNLVKVEEAYDQAFNELQELLRKLEDIRQNRVEAVELREAEPIQPPTPVTPAGEGGPRFGGGRTRRVEDPLRFTSGGIPYLERTGPVKRTKEGLPIGESLRLGAGGPGIGPITFLPPDPFGGGGGGGGGGSRRTRRRGGLPIQPISSNQPFRDSDWNFRRREGFGGGDPQCSSYDGFRFECNFLGEALWTRCGTFAVHVFAERPSNTSRATVIKGFALKQETNSTDVFYAALTEEQNSSFEFALNGEEGLLIGDFLTGTLTGTQLLLETDEGHRVKATFRQIDIFLEVTLPDSCFNQSFGLLGNNNGVATDDLNASNNQVLSVNASGKTIYEDFVLSWCVTDFSSSLFPPRLWHPCNTSWVPLFVDELDLAACPDACGNSGLCCLDSSEVGEDFAVNNDKKVRVTLAAQEVTAWSFSAIPPQLFLPEQVLLPTPTASELQVAAAAAAPVSFTVFALANSEPELNCSICRRAEVLCEVTGPSLSSTSLFNVSLSVTGQSLPPGSAYCVANANGLSAIGGVQLLQAPLLFTATTSAGTTATTNAASTAAASTTTSAAPTAAVSTTTSAAPTATAALTTTSAAPTAAESTTAAEPFGTGTTSTRDSLTTCLTYTCMQHGFVKNTEAKDVACVGACDDDTCCVATCATFSCPGPWPVRPDEVCGATSDTCNFATCCLRKRFRRRRNRRNRGAYHYNAGRQGFEDTDKSDNDSLQIITEEIMFMQEDFDEL